MGLKAVLIHTYGEEEVVKPAKETFTLKELSDLLKCIDVQFMPSTIPNILIAFDRNGKDVDMWHTKVNKKASSLAKSSIGESIIVGDCLLCHKRFLSPDVLPTKKINQHNTHNPINTPEEPSFDFNPPPPPNL